jgi:anti-sigma regulatory factor (Ser/Thr protein kinase)
LKRETIAGGWFELQVESSLENLEAISNFIAKTMRTLGIQDEKDIFDVQLAVDEACTNVIQYAYSGQKEGMIKIQCRLSESRDEFIVKITDTGVPFDPQSVPTPDITTALDERKIGGLGIFFMRQTIKTIKYAFGEKENELMMIRQLKSKVNLNGN